VLERLTHRWKARLEGSLSASDEASSASDGRPDLYDAQHARWKSCDPEKEPHVHHIVVMTVQPLPVSIEQLLDALHIPHFACWLSY